MGLLFLIPEGKGYVLQAVGVAYTSNAVLAPTVRSLSGLVVGEICERGQRSQLNALERNIRLQASPSAE